VHIQELQDQAKKLINDKNKGEALKLLNQALTKLESDEGRAVLQALPIECADVYQGLGGLFIEADDKDKTQGKELLGKAADLLVKKESYEKLKADELGTYIYKLSSLAKQLTEADEVTKVKEFLGNVVDLLTSDGNYGKLKADELRTYAYSLSSLAKQFTKAGEKTKAKELLGKVAELLASEKSHEKLKAEFERGNFLEYIYGLLDLAEQLTEAGLGEKTEEFLGKVADLLASEGSYEKLKEKELRTYAYSFVIFSEAAH
jgi:hypothetical protein